MVQQVVVKALEQQKRQQREAPSDHYQRQLKARQMGFALSHRARPAPLCSTKHHHIQIRHLAVIVVRSEGARNCRPLVVFLA